MLNFLLPKTTGLGDGATQSELESPITTQDSQYNP